MTYRFSALITKEDGWYVARCPELNVTSQGRDATALAPILAKLSSFISRPGAFLTLTNSFPYVLEYECFHCIEGVGCVCETALCKMLFELAHKSIALVLRCKIDRYASLVVWRCRGRGAKITAA